MNRQYYVFMTISFLLLISILTVPISAKDFNFEYSQVIDTGNVYLGLPKGYYDGVTGNWYVYYPKKDGSEAVITIKEFDNSWTETDSDTEDCGNPSDNCYEADCHWVVEEERYFSCIGRENDGTPFLKLYNYYFDNSSFVEIDSRTDYSTHPDTLTVTNSYNVLHGFDSFIRNGNWFYTNDYDLSNIKTLDVPSFYEDYDDIQGVICDGNYHFFVLKDGYITALTYEPKELQVHPFFELDYLNNLAVVAFSDNITENNFGVNSINDVIYVATTGTNNGNDVINIQALECDGEQLNQIYSENIDQNDIYLNLEGSPEDIINIVGTDNIVMYYHLNDSDTSITDYSGLNNDGTYNGNLYNTDGYIGNSLGFDGVDDLIETTYTEDFNFTSTDEFTVSAWFKWDGETDVNNGDLVGHYSSTGDNRGWVLQIRNNATRFIVCSDGTIGSCKYSTDTNTIQKDKWYWVLGKFNGTHSNVYVNSTPSSDIEAIGTVYNPSTYDIRTGRLLSQEYFDGDIDEVIIWNRSLSDSEIIDIYNNYTNIEDFGVMSNPYLTKIEDAFYLFHRDSNEGIRVIYEDPCECGEWIDTGECQEEYEKQIRDCVSNLCTEETEVRFIESEYCEKEYNRSLGIFDQQYESDTVCYECESDWKYFEDGETTAKCEPQHYTIPSGAVNITTNSTTISVLDGSGCNKGNYDLEVCNPSYDCNEETFSCETPVNFTLKNNENYNSGDIVTSKMSIRVDSICRCPRFLISDKIKRFKVLGVTCINYKIPCEQEAYCLDANYKAIRNIDCSVTNQTLCEYGCEDGECIGIGEQKTITNPDTVWNWLINPSDTQKFGYSVLFTLIIGGIGILLGNLFKIKGNGLGLIFTLFSAMAFIFFILVSWIPEIVIILMTFFVLLYFALKVVLK